MSAAELARVGTGLAFVVMPLVFVFAFAIHPALPRTRVLGPEQLIDRVRGRRLLHAAHARVTLNTALMIVVALHLGHLVARDGAGWAALAGTGPAVGVLLIGFPDGAEIVNLGAALIMAAGLVPFGLEMVLEQGVNQ